MRILQANRGAMKPDSAASEYLSLVIGVKWNAHDATALILGPACLILRNMAANPAVQTAFTTCEGAL